MVEGFRMKEELVQLGEGILKGLLARGADEAMVIPIHRDTLMVRFSNNKVTVVQDWNVRAVEALSVFGKKRVVSRFEDVGEKALEAGMERVARQVKTTPEAPDRPRLPEGKVFPDHVSREGIDAERVSQGVGMAIDSALREGAERVSGVLLATIARHALLGSNGARGYDERSLYELNVRAFRGEGSGQGVSCGTRIDRLDPRGAGGEAGRVALLSSVTAEWSEGRHDVLFGPIIGANLMERVGEASSAFSVEAGTSSLAGKIGQKVFSESMTVVDDGSSEDSPHARLFDDEGAPTRKNILVERGRLRTYLHNSSTAERFETASTGNAGWIHPGPWSLVVGSGYLGFDELLEDLNDGVYMVSNWYTRFQNYSTGDFSTISRDGAFLVRGGELAGALKGVRISDNLVRVFSAVDAVAKESRWIKWWEVRTPVLMPALISREVNLTKAQRS